MNDAGLSCAGSPWYPKRMRTRFLLPFLLFGVLGASVACQVGQQPVSSVTPAAVPPTAAPKATVVGKSFAAADPVIQIGKQYTATLKTDNFGASLELRNASGKQAVVVNAPDEHGQVGVFSPDGKPRAALKSSKLGGTVNVIQGNGHPGVYLLAEESGGKCAAPRMAGMC